VEVVINDVGVVDGNVDVADGAVLALSAVIQLVLVVTVDWCGLCHRLPFG
jgi:hypothetical protein